MINKRIENLQLCKASYLGETPEHPSYHIDLWKPNEYYGKEHMFIKDGDYYKHKEPEYSFCRIHKLCFKNPEVCFAIASFDYDEHEDVYELHFIGDRPLQLNAEERTVFWDLIAEGYKVLNTCEDD